MSDFRAALDEEVGKAVDDSIKKNHGTKKEFNLNLSIRDYFAVSTFLKVTLFWLLVAICAVFWFWSQKSSTMDTLASRLASKTVLIEKGDANTYRISEPSPILDSTIETMDVEGTAEPTENIESLEVVDDQPLPEGSLAAAPIPELFESTSDGLIPKARLSDGLTPFNAYKRPFSPSTNKPKLSFVGVHVGMSRQTTEKMIADLPASISFAFSPYAPDIKLLADASRAAGHEMWMMIPLENESYPRNDPGPNTLLVNASIEQNQARLLSTMGRSVGYVGLVAWPGHVFTTKDVDTSPSVQQIFGRGLAVLDSAPQTDRDFGRKVAYANEFPYAKNNFWLNENMSEAMLSQKLQEVGDYASARGEAMVMFYPYPHIISFLSKWLSSANAAEFELAPASYIAEYRDE